MKAKRVSHVGSSRRCRGLDACFLASITIVVTLCALGVFSISPAFAKAQAQNTNATEVFQAGAGEHASWVQDARRSVADSVFPHGLVEATGPGINLDVIGYDLVTGSPSPTPGPGGTVLGNISTRLRIETGSNVLIGGFIVTGTQPKRVILRAIGPSLASFFPGAITDTVLELHDSSGGLIARNDDWDDNQEQEIIDTGLAPTNSLESAIVRTLSANNSSYTAIVSGYNGLTGIGVVEAYDLDRTANSKLANISTRGLVTTGDNVMIGGTIIVGTNQARVLLRAIGPSLAIFGVANALSDTTLELHDANGAVIGFNDDWRMNQELEIIGTSLPPGDDHESAIVGNFAPAAYTAIVRGVQGRTGVALVEAYQLQ